LEKVHGYTEYSVCLVLYRVTIEPGSARAASVKSMAWVQAHEFANYSFPPADEASARLLLS